MESGAAVQIRSIVEVTELMQPLSEQGLQLCEDGGWLLLHGPVRECSFRIRDAAQVERKANPGNGRTGREERK